MSIRKLERSIAKARLKEMGVERVNRKMGRYMNGSSERRIMRTRKGRKRFARFLESDMPVWRRVLWGDLAKQYLKMKQQQKKKQRASAYAR